MNHLPGGVCPSRPAPLPITHVLRLGDLGIIEVAASVGVDARENPCSASRAVRSSWFVLEPHTGVPTISSRLTVAAIRTVLAVTDVAKTGDLTRIEDTTVVEVETGSDLGSPGGAVLSRRLDVERHKSIVPFGSGGARLPGISRLTGLALPARRAMADVSDIVHFFRIEAPAPIVVLPGGNTNSAHRAVAPRRLFFGTHKGAHTRLPRRPIRAVTHKSCDGRLTIGQASAFIRVDA
jgi:hypothetical protein